MDIKFNVQDVAIQTPELQLDIKIGHINYEVTGLDIKDYAQVMAKLPALIADIRKATTSQFIDPVVSYEQQYQTPADADKSAEEIDQQHAPYPNKVTSYHPDF